MGFFSSLGRGFRSILNIGKGVRDTVRRVYNTAKSIPVVGGIVRTIESTPIGQRAKDIANLASTGVDIAQQAGDFLSRNMPR